MATKRPPWAEQWTWFLNHQQYQEAISFLNEQASASRGTPSTRIKSQAIKQTLGNMEHPDLYEVACQLAILAHPTAKEIASYLFISVYDQQSADVMEKLTLLADDEDWEVREWVASACGERLTADFDHFYPEMVNWVSSESPNVRRAAALSVKYACNAKKTEWAETLLDLIEPLLTDGDPYVKKNLGPFTIGDALLRAYPFATLERLKKWNEIGDENVRWNIAKVFTTAEGAKMANQSISILKDLLGDKRPMVKRAMESAMKNLMERSPEVYDQLVKEIRD